MPITKLGQRFSPPRPPIHYLSNAMHDYKQMNHLSGEEIAQLAGVTRKTASTKMGRPASEWTIGEIKMYADIVGLDFVEALDAARKEIEDGS